jgi:hypothetical protein
MTLARMIRIHKISDTPYLSQHGLREMEEKDLPGVTDLFTRYMQRFDMAPEITLKDARHHFLSGRGEAGDDPSRREGQVVWSYVVEVSLSENSESHDINHHVEPYNAQNHRFLLILLPSLHNHQ